MVVRGGRIFARSTPESLTLNISASAKPVHLANTWDHPHSWLLKNSLLLCFHSNKQREAIRFSLSPVRHGKSSTSYSDIPGNT